VGHLLAHGGLPSALAPKAHLLPPGASWHIAKLEVIMSTYPLRSSAASAALAKRDDEPDFSFEAAAARRDELRRVERELELWEGRRPEVEAYRGGATAEEKRATWHKFNPYGPSGRTAAPTAFALQWLHRSLGDEADAAFDAAGAAKQWRDAVFGDFDIELAEAQQLVVAERLFDRARLGQFVRSRFPEAVAQADGLRELAQVVSMLRGTPDWVWGAPPAPHPSSPDVRGELEEA
jgi:hypothetical protein